VILWSGAGRPHRTDGGSAGFGRADRRIDRFVLFFIIDISRHILFLLDIFSSIQGVHIRFYAFSV
jgi:hypothetical protein